MDQVPYNSMPPLSTPPLPPSNLISQPNPLQADCTQWLNSLLTLHRSLDYNQHQSTLKPFLHSAHISYKIKALTPLIAGTPPIPSILANLHQRTSLILEKSMLKVWLHIISS